MRKSNYEIEVLVNGHPVKEYLHNGKIYIEGKNDSNFSIRIKNNSSSRILAVPSVDGISVIDGKTASLKSRGYIIDGYDSLVIDGWRTSDDTVSKFFFTSKGKSYAKKIGKGQNVGVIGVAIFREKPIYKVYYSQINTPPVINDDWGTTIMRSTSQFLCCSSTASQAIGTGFGETKASSVVTTTFNREDNVDEVFEMFYNSKDELKKIGVKFDKPVYIEPNAFPGDYCKPPEN